MDKWAEYREKFCGCKDASSYNPCEGLANCYLRPDHPERKTQAVVAKIARNLNELVIQALSRATGTFDPNPYSYLNRMSKNDNRDGTTVYLDGSPILWVGRPSVPFDARVTWGADYVMTIDTPYRFMGEEKPAESDDRAGPVTQDDDQPS